MSPVKVEYIQGYDTRRTAVTSESGIHKGRDTRRIIVTSESGIYKDVTPEGPLSPVKVEYTRKRYRKDHCRHCQWNIEGYDTRRTVTVTCQSGIYKNATPEEPRAVERNSNGMARGKQTADS